MLRDRSRTTLPIALALTGGILGFGGLGACASPRTAAPAPASGPAAAAKSALITHVRVVDGTGAPARRASVRISAGRVAAVGDLAPLPGEDVVDGGDRVLAPGFIDTHSHADDGLAKDPGALGAVSQGITTVVVGQDGTSHSPLAEFFASLERAPVAVNVASYSGHNTLRQQAMGDDFRRHATPAEVAAMRDELAREMKAGALGLSTGLEYDPGIYSDRSEVLALAPAAAARGRAAST
jgi:N-acyl-D-amino-acid deacylase